MEPKRGGIENADRAESTASLLIQGDSKMDEGPTVPSSILPVAVLLFLDEQFMTTSAAKCSEQS